MISLYIIRHLFFHIWNQIEAVMYITWISKIPQNGFILHLSIFEAEIENGTSVCHEDVSGPTDYDNVCFRVVW